MARTISARQFTAALQKAKNVAQIEETFTLDGVQLTLRTLGPDLEVLVAKELPYGPDFSEAERANAFVANSLARAIVELEDMDLRDVLFIDDVEVPAPTPADPDAVAYVRLEKHAYLLRCVLSTWSKSALLTAFEKLSEITEESERRARQGVVFKPPAETPDEKARRLLVDLRETSEALPVVLFDRLLAEYGLGRRLEDALRAVNEVAQNLPEPEIVPDDEDDQGDDPEASDAPEPEPTPTPPPPPPTRPVRPRVEAAQALPLRTGSRPPQPAAQAQQHALPRMPAIVPKAKSLAYAELEGAGAPELAESLRAAQAQMAVAEADPATNTLVLDRKRARGPADVAALLVEEGQPATGGINPRFRPPPRGLEGRHDSRAPSPRRGGRDARRAARASPA